MTGAVISSGIVSSGIVLIGDTPEAAALRQALRRSGARFQTEETAEPSTLWIDAAHPFAESQARRFSPSLLARLHAENRIIRVGREPWRPRPGDQWRRVYSPEAALAALEPTWRRIFLALGRDRLEPFERDDARWYLTRIRDGAGAPTPTPQGMVTPDPGPFTPEGEAALLSTHRIDAIVARNAGGVGAYPKIAAARALGLPVVLLEPPPLEPPFTNSPAAALAWVAERVYAV